MAIINRTPDSFFDGGRTFALDAAVQAALKAVDDGADWVDIGGVPFAPGPPLSAAEEAARVVPVIPGLSTRTSRPRSPNSWTSAPHTPRNSVFLPRGSFLIPAMT